MTKLFANNRKGVKQLMSAIASILDLKSLKADQNIFKISSKWDKVLFPMLTTHLTMEY